MLLASCHPIAKDRVALGGEFGSPLLCPAPGYDECSAGYGQSEGEPDEKGFKRDAAAAGKYAVGRRDVLNTMQVFLFGRSIGGAVALAAAAQVEHGKIAGVVVKNTFSPMGDSTFRFSIG